MPDSFFFDLLFFRLLSACSSRALARCARRGCEVKDQGKINVLIRSGSGVYTYVSYVYTYGRQEEGETPRFIGACLEFVVPECCELFRGLFYSLSLSPYLSSILPRRRIINCISKKAIRPCTYVCMYTYAETYNL